MSKKNLKAGASYTLSNLLLKATSIITAPIFTRILSPSDYGIIANFFSWATIFIVLTGLGFTYAIGNAYIDLKDKLNEFISSITISGILFSSFLSVFIYFFKTEISILTNIDEDLIYILIPYIIFYPAFTILLEKLKFDINYFDSIKISFSNTIGGVVLSVILILYIFNLNPYVGRIVGMSLPIIFIGLMFTISQIKSINFNELISNTKYALKICTPMIPHSLFMIMITQLDRVMLSHFSGDYETGIYSFGFSYGSLIIIFINSFVQALQPKIYEDLKNNITKNIYNIVLYSSIFLSLLSLALITFTPEVLHVLGTKDFYVAEEMTVYIIFSGLFQFFTNTLIQIELYYKKAKYIAIGTILTATINFILNLILIPKFGFIGASIATLTAYSIILLYHSIICKKMFEINLFNSLKYFIIIFLLIVGLFISQIYNYIFIRYLIFFGIVIISGFAFKKEILNIYKYIKFIN